jgi:hypothetical protein
VPVQAQQWVAGCRIPEFGRTIQAGSGNAFPVMRNRNDIDTMQVAFEGPQFVAVGGVPYLGHGVHPAGHNPFAVRGKDGGVDLIQVSAQCL